MKKVLFIAIVVLFMLTMVLAQITTQPKEPKQEPLKPMSSLVLPKNEAQEKEFGKWQQLYGITEKTHVYYNLALLIKVADQHGRTINSNREYIYMVLAADDPNSLASMVVADHNSIGELVKENTELRNIIKELTARIDKLENNAVVDAVQSIRTGKIAVTNLDGLERFICKVDPNDPNK